jgi:hypothetical protein
LFAALLVITTLCDTALLLRAVLEREINQAASLSGYLRITWLASCMATLGRPWALWWRATSAP